MTFDVVMEVFSDWLRKRQDIEVACLRRGCQIFVWKEEEGCYMAKGKLCETPDGLFRALADLMRASLVTATDLERRETEIQLAACIHRFRIFYKTCTE